MDDRLKDYEVVMGEDGYPDINIKVGDTVLDDLTGKVCTVQKCTKMAVLVDSDYLEGWRHDWEVTKLKRKNTSENR